MGVSRMVVRGEGTVRILRSISDGAGRGTVVPGLFGVCEFNKVCLKLLIPCIVRISPAWAALSSP